MSKTYVTIAAFLLSFFHLAGGEAKTVCPSPPWPAWQHFQERFISTDGRVIDPSDERKITTSEGQSYALFFALLNNDQALFQKLLHWTENNLAQGDLSRHLPAWLWGQTAQGDWQVLDNNSAADSDLWIAYSLLEAGRLWQQREYTLLGHLLAQKIAEHELRELPGFAYVLLPGPKGFVKDESWRLNPSYAPPQLFERMRKQFPDHIQWQNATDNLANFLVETSPLGIAPDWVWWYDQQWQFAPATNPNLSPWGSYDAIRVYLWVGMLAKETTYTETLQQHFSKALAFIDNNKQPVEKVNVLSGQGEGIGSTGFSAALLPLFGNTSFGAAQRQRLADAPLKQQGYYSMVLQLFGQGYDEKRYKFDAAGYLQPLWTACQ